MTEGEFLRDLEKQATGYFEKYLGDHGVGASPGDETGGVFRTGHELKELYPAIEGMDAGFLAKYIGGVFGRGALRLSGFLEDASERSVLYGTLRCMLFSQEGKAVLIASLPAKISRIAPGWPPVT